MVQLGQLVSAKAGRDRGKYFLVIKIIDDSSVYIADGDLRSVKKPKKKNLKHLTIHREMAAEVARKLNSGLSVSNVEILAALRALVACDKPDHSVVQGG